MAQFLRPDSDVANVGGWTPVPATPITLYDKIDEVTPSDTDYAYLLKAETAEYFEVGLSNPVGTPGIGDNIVSWRPAKLTVVDILPMNEFRGF